MISVIYLTISDVHAGIIRSAVSATASDEICVPVLDVCIDNTIDQSGLINQSGSFMPYNSGVDDYDTYLSLNPFHSDQSAPNEWFTHVGVLSATVTYDLGSLYSLDSVALWVEETLAPHSDVSFLVSEDGFDFDTIFSNLLLPDNIFGIYPATRYDFDAVNAQYFQIQFGQCATNNNGGCSLGEIAFSTGDAITSPVPTPPALAMFLLGMLGLTLASRRIGSHT